MDPKYLKLSKGDKDVYFRINKIKKYYRYSSHGVELYDYDIIINDMYVYDKSIQEIQGIQGTQEIQGIQGLFLYIDEKKNIRIYDNIKKEYYDIEDNDDVNHISYFYYGNTYCTSLHNAVKEILLKVIVDG